MEAGGKGLLQAVWDGGWGLVSEGSKPHKAHRGVMCEGHDCLTWPSFSWRKH